MKAEASDSMPVKALLSEIDVFRDVIHRTLAAYEAKLNEELTILQAAAETRFQETGERQGKLRDIRDMLTVLRSVDIKPEKGRRKDFKKLESVVEDLSVIAENW